MNNIRLFTLLCLLFVAFRVQSNDLLTEWQKMHQTKQKELEQFND
jgi:hypothetical protein